MSSAPTILLLPHLRCRVLPCSACTACTADLDIIHAELRAKDIEQCTKIIEGFKKLRSSLTNDQKIELASAEKALAWMQVGGSLCGLFDLCGLCGLCVGQRGMGRCAGCKREAVGWGGGGGGRGGWGLKLWSGPFLPGAACRAPPALSFLPLRIQAQVFMCLSWQPHSSPAFYCHLLPVFPAAGGQRHPVWRLDAARHQLAQPSAGAFACGVLCVCVGGAALL